MMDPDKDQGAEGIHLSLGSKKSYSMPRFPPPWRP